MTMGDRVAVFNQGRRQQCDEPQTLYDNPANLFVAAFIGSPAMNLYRAVLDSAVRNVRIGNQELALPYDYEAPTPWLPIATGQW